MGRLADRQQAPPLHGRRSNCANRVLLHPGSLQAVDLQKQRLGPAALFLLTPSLASTWKALVRTGEKGQRGPAVMQVWPESLQKPGVQVTMVLAV